MVSLAAKFPLKWPPALEALFRAQDMTSSVSDGVVSLDCSLAGQVGLEVALLPPYPPPSPTYTHTTHTHTHSTHADTHTCGAVPPPRGRCP